jgi:hypothetical protein
VEAIHGATVLPAMSSRVNTLGTRRTSDLDERCSGTEAFRPTRSALDGVARSAEPSGPSRKPADRRACGQERRRSVDATVSMGGPLGAGGLTRDATGLGALGSDPSAVGSGGYLLEPDRGRVPIGALPHKAPSQF